MIQLTLFELGSHGERWWLTIEFWPCHATVGVSWLTLPGFQEFNWYPLPFLTLSIQRRSVPWP